MVMGDLPQETDVLIIGGGPGGYVAALRAATLGKKVILVEKEKLGGMCLHYGCIPSKTLIHAANFVEDARHAEEIGLSVSTTVNVEKLRAWKQSVIGTLCTGIEHLCKKRGVTVIQGTAQFESPNRALIHLPDGAGKQGIEFGKAIIATGSKSIEIPGFPFSHPRIWSSRDALELSEIPPRLVVIGAGYIGMELGFMYAKLGSNVTMIESLPSFMPHVDDETRRLLEKRMKELGVDLKLNCKVEGFTETTVTAATDRAGGKSNEKSGKNKNSNQTNGPETLEIGAQDAALAVKTSMGSVYTDYILVCVGHKPFTDGLALDKARVLTDERGFIATNISMQTNQPHIYAIGDVRGGPLLAHKAYLEGKVAGEHAAGQNVAFLAKVIPSVIFCDPEIASAGLTEAEAKKQGLMVKTGRFPFQASGRALSMNAGDGFVKVVASQDNTILGVQIVGPDAGELIGEAVLAIELGATVEDFAMSIHPHPTLSEGLSEAMENFLGKGVHS
ncbi:dihydrolipoyl dehydrogenase [Candidatus Micrarchaeota archaeon]|nr:dihydrolipoyl dehydrogenase [Candidatus Micrarchaeota archaeon]